MTEQKDVIIVTTDAVPGRRVRAVLGMVWGTGNAVGEARREARYSLLEQARSKGADAVVGVRVDSFVVPNTDIYGHQWLPEFTFYGTAVLLD